MRILITGGGTGGHLFPGIALAEEFQDRSPHNRIIFVGTRKGIEQRIIPSMGYELKTISSAGMLGKGMFQKFSGAVQCFIGIFQAMMIIRVFRPDLVLGTGGYVSSPVILAAYLLGIETAICEQNSIPGLSNRILARLAKKIFIAFEESSRFFPLHKTFLTGNPVRKKFLTRHSFHRKDRNRFCVFIIGGSQGAHSINKSMIEALNTLLPVKNKLEIIHQTGLQDFSWVKEEYEKQKFRATVSPFITEMASVYSDADLVISRAGALTLSELLIYGKPSVLIPYPFAAYNHQEVNAKSLADKGAAQIILNKENNGVNLGNTIIYLINHPQELKKMGIKAQELSRPEAAQIIVDHYCSSGTKGGE
ncbi:MAG: undecaprenyldiphospho-muramoylpentapeptide beta-N-acetylglucosaminyltransferase [Proteobacteria bacterium]|nr:undecaprenyldiphospho-muramoylpentapeptide beta-N-acetylglucosaminyltransferase [Pseudomonadota bacterium]